MHAAIASSRQSPYMWIVSGPTWRTPLWGEGIDAVRAGTGGFCPARRASCFQTCLEQDSQRDVGRAARTDEVNRVVQIDVVPRRELLGSLAGIARTLQPLHAPRLDQLQLWI